jgi:ribosome recycling factor
VKRAKAEGENAKVAVRNNRKDAMDMIKALKEDGLPEDMQKDGENQVQNLTNGATAKIDDLIKAKEVDIMTI